MSNIPHIIHYCWFGEKEKPNDVKKYIETWKKHFPDWKIKEWNESNFSIPDAPIYVQEAYSAKKYAFVSDYARLVALYNEGGIYFDTDVEVLRNFEDKLEGYKMVLSYEYPNGLSAGIMAMEPHLEPMAEFMKLYQDIHFIKEDGSYDLWTINSRFNRHIVKYGVVLNGKFEFEQELDNGIKVYLSEVFSAFDIKAWHEKVTENTCSIHHMSASWLSPKAKAKYILKTFVNKLMGKKK